MHPPPATHPRRRAAHPAARAAGPGAFGWLVATGLAAAALLPGLPTAATAAVAVPPTVSGYTTIATDGVTLDGIDLTLSPSGTTVVGSTVWLIGPPQSRTVQINYGGAGWLDCPKGRHLSQPAGGAGGVTSYLCPGPGQATPAGTTVQVRVLR